MDEEMLVEARRRALRAPGAPDAPSEREFDVIVRQAAAAIGTRMALVSLPGEGGRRITARVGIEPAEAPIIASFGGHAMRGSGTLIVPDATRDARFAADPLVTGRPHIRFYAGAAIELDGARVGTLCVLDDQARHAVTELQAQYLRYLADRTAAALRARRQG